MNGRPGDDAIADIAAGRRVYSAAVDDLVLKITRLLDLRGVEDFRALLQRDFYWRGNPDIPRLEEHLRSRLDTLQTEGKVRGWEVDQ